MSSHVSRQLATALATALAARTWTTLGTQIPVEMKRKPDYLLEDLGTLVVSTVPGPVTLTTETRAMEVAEVMIGVVIADHVGSEGEISKLEDLEQEIVDQIRSGHIVPAGMPDGTDWTEIANPVPYDAEQLETRNVFLGQITVTFKVPLDRV